MRKKKSLIISAIALMGAIVLQGQSAKWTYSSNHDGDSVTVTNSQNERTKVRLLWIDAPELSQPMGQASRNHLESILTKRPNNIIVSGDKRDSYQRLLGEIYTSNGRSVNKEMVRAGMAYFYRQYCKAEEGCNYSKWNDLEWEAKKNQRGVWKFNLVKPWEYRRQEREKKQNN